MNNILRKSILFSLLFSYSVCSIAQDECSSNQIFAARANYNIGRFIECLDELKPCIAKNGFAHDDKIQAYALCAMCYLAMDSVANADKYIQQLVIMDDNYTGDVDDPERLKLRIAYIRLQLRAQLTSSVSKKTEKIELAPAAMQIITAEDIQNRGYTNIESVFSDLPGFDITTTYGISYSVLYQDGYRSPAFTERTMIMIDGIEDNELYSNAAFISMQYPISSVKRIEVIYGPASTIYGANAFCGVINIVTKDEEDLFANTNGKSTDKPANFAMNLQGGVASYNTRYLDGTLSARNKNIFFSVTGRVYLSDGINLSSQPYWNGAPSYTTAQYVSDLTVPYTAANAAKYVGQYFQVSSDSSHIVPTTAGINRADSLDKARYKSALNNGSVFSDPINDFYVAAKLKVNNFTFGCQYWNKDEGATGDYVDNYLSPNAQYTNWQVRQYFMYSKYEKQLSDHFNISSLTYYRYSDYGNHSYTTSFAGYGSGNIKDSGLIAGQLPGFSTTNFYVASNEITSELKSQYIINDKFDILAGTEFATGIYQANYITTATYPALLNGEVAASPGGNNITDYTTSGYATGSYHDVAPNLNIDLGGRVDHNQFREVDGYGTVFNPRIDVVYYPKKFVFKGIYATAFENASNANKLSTASSRELDNPTLAPEQVKNLEFSIRYKITPRDYVEVVAYRSHYTNTIELVNVPYNGGYTQQYQDVGQSLIYGAQAASEIFIANSISIYSNITYTDPTSIFTSVSGADSSVRTGDIATISANAGVNIGFFNKKLNLNTRVNIVGNKPTGEGTSVATNPLTDIPGYALLNATLGYRITKNVLLQVGCNNILNSTYFSPGVRSANGTVYAPEVLQPGRTYVAKVIVDLKK